MKRLGLVFGPICVVAALLLVFTFSAQPEAARDYEAAYAPEQPIQFSHKLHAGEMEMPCQYCHIYAERSRSAGVPPVQTCYNCHKIVPGSTEQGKKDVQKIREAYQNDDPIEWVKVHDLQDFATFTHRAHVKYGKELDTIGDEGFTCQDCHGPVESMEVAELRAHDPELDETPLTMGWCLSCHKQKAADVAELEKLKAAARERDVAWKSLIGEVEASREDARHTLARLRDCTTCHY